MALKTYREHNPRVYFNDTFEDSTCGWQQLMGGTYSAPYGENAAGGSVSLVSFPSLDGGSSLEFHSEDVASSTPSADPMVLKRLTREQPDADGRYIVKWDLWFAYKALHFTGSPTPRAIDFGLDTATGDGSRHFGKFRLFTNDASNKWQMASGVSPGTFTDIPDTAGLITGINENKSGWNHLTFYFDVANHKYLALVINGNEIGSVSAPDGGTPLVDGTPLPTAGGVDEFMADAAPLPSFAHGLNFACQIRNRTDTADSKAWAYIARTTGSRV